MMDVSHSMKRDYQPVIQVIQVDPKVIRPTGIPLLVIQDDSKAIKMKNDIYQVSKIVQSDDEQVIQVDQKLSWFSLTGIMFFVMDETPRIMKPKLKDVGKGSSMQIN